MVRVLRVKKRGFTEWHKRFQDGRKDVEDDGRPGTSTTDGNVVKVKETVYERSRRITNREVADDVGGAYQLVRVPKFFRMFWV